MDEKFGFSILCKANQLHLSADQIGKLDDYVKLLLRWNKELNLLSRKDESSIWVSHILHSLSLAPRVLLPQGCNVLDLGTGGGLPGVPIAIMRPDLRLTLLDSVRKKTDALKEIVSDLGISNVAVSWGRAGELKLKDLPSAGFDVVLARAVAPLKDLIRWSLTLVRRGRSSELVGGTISAAASFCTPFLVAMKGGPLEEELRMARIRYKDKKFSAFDLSLKGVLETDLVDKKLLVVEL